MAGRQHIAVAAALTLSWLTGEPVMARTSQAIGHKVTANATELFNFAEQLARRGATEQAERILIALTGNPDADVRNEARFRHAKLRELRGDTVSAAVMLRRIIEEKPGSVPVRLELAGILDRMGDKEGAWRQIRAVQSAGLPPAVARLVDRYSEALRVQRPFGASFEIALAPDSNINRATRSATLGTVLGDFRIDKSSKARSGTGVLLNAQAYRRIELSEGRAGLLLRATSVANIYKAKRFNDMVLDVAAGPEFQIGGNRLNLEIGATQRWLGHKPLLRSARIAVSWSRPIGRRSELRLSGSGALVDYRLSNLQDSKNYSAQIGFEHAVSPESGLAANFGIDRQIARNRGYSTTERRVGLTAWRDIGRLTLTAGFEIGKLDADARLNLFPHRRVDRYLQLSFGATFRQLQFHGFAPVARFSLERNRSTVELYDYRRAKSELGIVRAF